MCDQSKYLKIMWNSINLICISVFSVKCFYDGIFQETNWTESVFQSAFTVFYSLLGLGIPSSPMQSSGRILCLSICITGAIIFWSYSAGLVSCLTVEKFDFPINSLQVGRIKWSELRNCSSLKKMFKLPHVTPYRGKE